ncbi:MAG: GTPase HflX [Clostridia bacterium]|nr:GTPase HflX [Clostridia bacterium]
MSENKNTIIPKDENRTAGDATPIKAVLVGVVAREERTAADSMEEAEKSLDELERLLDTAGGETFARMIQKTTPDPRTLIGSGKVKELADLCHNNDIGLVVFDCDLSPVQIRNLEDDIGGDNLRVIDRSILILDIFALHAVTSEGKLQVELAQLQYTAPRLTGHGTEMSRLGGGIGTRGPGESKLESDRRHMKRRIDALKAELEVVEKNRRTMRASRDRSGVPKIAIVGYTNAGKSTLLNTLTGAGILAEDKLFATLDPTTRKFTLPSGESVLLTDTVGFIKKLPHHLVNAFRSTLEEAVYADIIMLLLDASDPECASQLEVTEQLLEELGAGGKPTLYVFNKCDRESCDTVNLMDVTANKVSDRDGQKRAVCISALTGQGCDELAEAIQDIIQNGKRKVTFVIPNAEQGALSRLYSEKASVESVDYGYDAVTVVATVDDRVYGLMKKYDPNAKTVKEEDLW